LKQKLTEQQRELEKPTVTAADFNTSLLSLVVYRKPSKTEKKLTTSSCFLSFPVVRVEPRASCVLGQNFTPYMEFDPKKVTDVNIKLKTITLS
jgi:hypothetical protein